MSRRISIMSIVVLCAQLFGMEEHGASSGVVPWGVAARQGDRDYMEDFYTIKGDEKRLFAAVFDGHGGPLVAKRLSEKLYPKFMEYRDIPAFPIDEALKEAFRDLEDDILREKIPGGSTAVVCHIEDGKVYYALVGDSRAVDYSLDGTVQHKTLDHKPYREDEKRRILMNGGAIDFRNRLLIENLGTLGMSRAFGDKTFKEFSPSLIAAPEISESVFAKGDYVVIASDGLWDTVRNERVPDIIREDVERYDVIKKSAEFKISCGQLPQRIAAEKLRDYAVLDRGCGDNTTVIVAGDIAPGIVSEELDKEPEEAGAWYFQHSRE